ncbi:MAG TPA: histidine phosphatase family protein [Hyphomicrobium sp.]|nr:histidine phosphatase family protein [Hyphomicrobium sp.]
MLSLALLRHAKSSWDATDIDDFDRPLNDRGRTAAPLMGAALQELNFAPELILCSSAKRTRETLGLVTPFVKDAKVMFDDQLYLTSQETLYARLKAVPTDVKRVLMIGHNPGMHGLALFLTMLVMMPVGEKASPAPATPNPFPVWRTSSPPPRWRFSRSSRRVGKTSSPHPAISRPS